MKLLLYSLCALAALTATVSVNAATRTVTKTADTNDGVCNADCSLREAIAVSISGDTIAFSSLFNSAQTITLGSEIAVSSKNLSITGPGADKLTIDGGAGTNRIFSFTSSTVTISGMALTGGNGAGVASSGFGGAIYSSGGALTVDGVYAFGNTTSSNGGVIYIHAGSGHVIRNSTFSSNSTGLRASAIFNNGSTSLTIINTTISGNTASSEAAIVHNGGLETIIQSCTVTNNSAGAAAGTGGIFLNGGGTVRLRSSIIAGNNAAALPEMRNNAGSIISEGFNLIGDSSGDSANTGPEVAYQATDILDTDPHLVPLGYYVSNVPVHALSSFPASPAIDKGNAFTQTTDQRGFMRTYDNPSVSNAAGGDGTDIGSVELQATLAADVSLAGKVTNALGQPIRAAVITVQGSDGVVRRTLTSQFGYYRITGLEAGETYFVTVKAKRYTFANPTHSVNASDNLTGIDFTAAP